MPPYFAYALCLIWLTAIGYWLWSARFSKVAVLQEPFFVRMTAYWLPLVMAVFLLCPGSWFEHSLLHEPIVPHTIFVYSLGLGLAVVGATLAICSRAFLGCNWSATVQLKRNHELITQGPYRHIRHPIYTGFLLLFLGSALMIGDWRGLFAVAIVFISFWRKLRLEERWLTHLFGETYRAYQRRTKALVPVIF